MDFRKIVLLTLAFGVVYAHTINEPTAVVENLSDENYLVSENQRNHEKVNLVEFHEYEKGHNENIHEKLSNFKGKTAQSLIMDKSKRSNIEGKHVALQETLTEISDHIQSELSGIQLEIDNVEIDNVEIQKNYYDCDNSSNCKNKTDVLIDQPQDCYEIYGKGYSSDGVYTIYAGDIPIQVFCDMSHGGWTVLQKRTDDSVDYTQDFYKYRIGFGDLDGGHWLGLNKMHEITKIGHWDLRFDLEDFEGETAWAEYSDFRVGAGTDYTLYYDIDSYRGTAGDGLKKDHLSKFTARDRDEDPQSYNCANHYFGGGGFWYGTDCGLVTTTGMPYRGENTIYWLDWKGHVGLKAATLKIKKKL